MFLYQVEVYRNRTHLLSVHLGWELWNMKLEGTGDWYQVIAEKGLRRSAHESNAWEAADMHV
jgi:hypothetical protein